MIIDNSFQSLTTVIIYIHTQRDRDIITNWFSTKTHTHTHTQKDITTSIQYDDLSCE